MTEVIERTYGWPYPVHYDKENDIDTDVLILGGGIAGCWAAIAAARKGASVTLVEKGATIRSGSGGTGCDHWILACTNPCSKVSPEEVTEAVIENYGGYHGGHALYITCHDSYDALVELEKMGVKVRDTDDKFKGADFRDEKTKLLFAYDYESRHCIRIWGTGIKPALRNECRRLGVKIYDRVMVTSLLNEKGEQGARVVGATGVNTRTGEFYIFKAKATVSSLGRPERIWVFSTELGGFSAFFMDPNCAGEGYDIGWRAGAAFTMMEQSRLEETPLSYPAYGTGNCSNTWYACTIVDANGKEIPWVDRDGRVLKTVSERYRPAPGQKFFLGGTMHQPTFVKGVDSRFYRTTGPHVISDLPERIRKGEFVLPLYADLPSMPEHERKAIFGLMVGQEGKTRIPIYETYTKDGFDPDKDLLQTTLLPPDAYTTEGMWRALGARQWRNVGFSVGCGEVTDWNLKTTLEGLYGAGGQIIGSHSHAGAACTGRYAGGKAAGYALKAANPEVDRKQVVAEKNRVYSPVKRKNGIDWKELNAGSARVMQDYCGEYRNEESLKIGLISLGELKDTAATNACARNPHELTHILECQSLITTGEMIMYASLGRKASSFFLGFKRLDYPDMDPPEWEKFVTIRLQKGEVKYEDLPHKYWLMPPNAATYQTNYKAHHQL